MRQLAVRLLIGLALVSICLEGPAPGQAAAPSAPVVWNADFEDNHCTITTGSIHTLGLSLWMTPGDFEPELYVVGPPDRVPRLEGSIRVEAGSGGQSFDAISSVETRGGARVLHIVQLPYEFTAAFASSSEIRLKLPGRSLVVPTKGAGKAVVALRKCVDEMLPGWGIDPKTFAALQKPPTEIRGKYWISGEDYPADAQRADWSGYLVVRLDVDAHGDVTSCAVVVSSGWKSVDQVTCRKAVTRARFHPAIGLDGKPKASARTNHIIFRLMG